MKATMKLFCLLSQKFGNSRFLINKIINFLLNIGVESVGAVDGWERAVSDNDIDLQLYNNYTRHFYNQRNLTFQPNLWFKQFMECQIFIISSFHHLQPNMRTKIIKSKLYYTLILNTNIFMYQNIIITAMSNVF